MVRTRVVGAQSGMNDPVLRILWVIFFVMLLGGILTGIMALLNGTIDISKVPETRQARQVIALKAELDEAENDTKAAIWQQYIVALLVNGQEREADKELTKLKAQIANETLKEDRAAYVLFIEASRARIQGDIDTAISTYEQARDETYAKYEDELKNGGDDGNWAKANGPDEVYSKCLAALMNLYEQKKDYASAIAAADAYIEANETDADALERRGDFNLANNDEAAALADYEKAFRFNPYNTDLEKKISDLGGNTDVDKTMDTDTDKATGEGDR
jgi:tetratricopeptide (TPR) repeat protein